MLPSYRLLLLSALLLVSLGAWSQDKPTEKKKKKPDLEEVDPNVRRRVPENANRNVLNDTTQRNIRGRGQGILDDTTQILYGPSTTEYFYVRNWFQIDTIRYKTDTSIVNFQRYNFPSRNDYLYYDLGNVGTPLNAFFFVFPETLGKRLGQDAMNPHTIPEHEFKYYNTRSPYSDWYYAQGGSGRAVVDINMAQNVTPDFNIGFRYFRLSSRFMLGQRPQQRNNLQGQRENFHLHTNFSTKNHRYRLLAHFNAMTHNLQESGGIDFDVVLNDTTGIYDLFEPENQGLVTNRLTQANSMKIRRRAYLYHQFSLLDSSDLLQLFQEVKGTTVQYRYTDDAPQQNIDFYPLPFPSDLSRGYHQLRYEELDVRHGGKGRLGVLFYAGWGRNRQYAQSTEFENNIKLPITLTPDNFAGFELAYTLGSDSSAWQTKAELHAENQLNGEGQLVRATLHNQFGEVRFQRGSYAPTQMQTYYIGDFFQWENDNFANQEAQQVHARLRLPNQRFALSVHGNATSLQNYLYFDTLALPRQAEETLSYWQAGIDFDVKFGYFRQIGKVLYTQTEDTTLLRMPEWLINYQVFFEKDVFKNAIFVQLGLDFHWNSTVMALGYMPVTQQFHLQNQYEAGGYLLTDLFLNFRLNRVCMFFKMTNLLQGAFSKRGYYTAPHYMAQPRELEFGVRWLLFD